MAQIKKTHPSHNSIMSNTGPSGAASTSVCSTILTTNNMLNLSAAAGLSCPVDRFLQTPFIADSETEKWGIKGLKALYVLIRELLSMITNSFNSQLSTAPAPPSTAVAGNSSTYAEFLKQITDSSSLPMLDIRILEAYRALFTACYTSKRVVEIIAVSGQARTPSPTGSDCMPLEYEAGASLQPSEHSVDNTAFVVSTHPGAGSQFSSDSTIFPSHISFDSPMGSELENVKASCTPYDPARLVSGGDTSPVNPIVFVPSMPSMHPIPAFTLSHSGLSHASPMSTPQVPLDCIPISLLPISVDQPSHKLSGIFGVSPESTRQKALGTPNAIPMKQQSCIDTPRVHSSPSSSTVTRQSSSRGHKETAAWSKEEDQLLEMAVGMFKAKNWRRIADFIYINGNNLPKRTADQCNQRWLRTIDPKITKGNWPAEEDSRLIAAVKACPPRNWKAISALMPNRTDVQIRGRLQRLAPMLLERGILTADQLPPISSNRVLSTIQSL